MRMLCEICLETANTVVAETFRVRSRPDFAAEACDCLVLEEKEGVLHFQEVFRTLFIGSIGAEESE